MITMGIDPDSSTTGYALFDAEGKLLQASAIAPVLVIGHLLNTTSDFVVTIECPQTYGGRAASGDANVLIQLARLVGRFEQAAHTNPRCKNVQVITPREWKGQVPKPISCLRSWQALDKAEQGYVKISTLARNKLNKGVGLKSGEASDALDAVGIALWSLQQTNKRRAT